MKVLFAIQKFSTPLINFTLGALVVLGLSMSHLSFAADDLLAKVKKDKVIVVGTEGVYPPFTYHEKNKLTGFDVEIFNEIAKRMGLEVKYVEAPWDALFAGLDAKRFDLIANQVGITDKRKEKYDFSDAYTSSVIALVVSEKNNTIHSLADIKGKKMGQSLTSNYSVVARKYGADIVSVNFPESIMLVKQGRVEGTLNDSLGIADFIKKHGQAGLRVIKTTEGESSSGFMVRKGEEATALIAQINAKLAEMKKDGTYQKIYSTYFEEKIN